MFFLDVSHVSKNPLLSVGQPNVWLAVPDGASPVRMKSSFGGIFSNR